MRTPELDLDRHERARIREEAVEWLLRLSADGADGAIQADCARWRAENPRHDEAMKLAERTWGALPATSAAEAWRDMPPAAADPSARAPGVSWVARLKSPWTIFAPVGLALAASALLLVFAAPNPEEVIATPVGEVRQVALQDGSTVDLGAASKMRVAINDRERRVTLDEGQAFFSVVHDPGRPFVVEASGAEIRVTGTKFDVWALGDDVRVSVSEGSVDIRRPSAGAAAARDSATTLVAGATATVENGRLVRSMATPGQAEPGEWRSGRLYYADAPLGVIVADANRYTREPIVIVDDDLKATRVTVSFRTGEVDQLFGALEGSLPVRIDRREGYVMIAPQ